MQARSLKKAWETVIGLEIHAQLSNPFKLFSNAPFDHQAPPNTNVALFDAAIPGSLPVIRFNQDFE